MKTCKECIHSECCFMQYGKTNALKWQSELGCKNFKDRSRFLELPCKVGDLIFIIKRTRGMFVRAAKVDSITITRSGRIQVSCYRSSFIGFWGVDAFATEEEAEQALKERENDEK